MDLHGGNVWKLARELNVDPGAILDFSSNVCPFGPPASVMTALKKGLGMVRLYPEPYGYGFVFELSKLRGLSPEWVIAGNGASELLFLLCSVISKYTPDALMSKKKLVSHDYRPWTAVLLRPCFSEYDRAVMATGGQIKPFWLDPGQEFQCDVAALKAVLDGARAVILGNPNNPTGRSVPREELLKVVRSCAERNVWVIVDESFVELTETPELRSVEAQVKEFPNLIAVRSLTKLFAIPGLRLGYAIARPEVINLANELRDPWSVNVLAQLVGKAAIFDTDYVAAARASLSRERKYLYRELSKFGAIRLFPSEVNFFLVDISATKLTSQQFAENLLSLARIVVRDASNFLGLDNRYVRIAVKRRRENRKLCSAMNLLLAT